MRCQSLVMVGLLAVSVSNSAHGVTIDFDSLERWDVVTTQFPEASFSTEDGFQITVRTGDLGSSLPNFICTDLAGAPDIGPPYGCSNEIIISFSNGVSGLSFLAVGGDHVGVAAQVDVFSSGSYADSIGIVTDGSPFIPDLVDLTAFEDVTSIRIHSVIDNAGLGFDDFTFIPEPSASLLFCLGLLGIGANARRPTSNRDRKWI